MFFIDELITVSASDEADILYPVRSQEHQEDNVQIMFFSDVNLGINSDLDPEGNSLVLLIPE